MDKQIATVTDILKDYRNIDGLSIDENVVSAWINQFDSRDQLFLLNELIPILKKRYVSQNDSEQKLQQIVKDTIEYFDKSNPVRFLENCFFIDHQPEGKSQKDLLSLFNEIIKSNYGVTTKDCGLKNPKYIIYLDDFLCTGDTLFKGLTYIENDGTEKGVLYTQYIEGQKLIDYIKNNDVKLLFVYFFIHKLNFNNFLFRLKKTINYDFGSKIMYYSFENIDNNYRDGNSSLSYLFPIRNNQSQRVLEYYNSLGISTDDGVFRNPNYPKKETFFSSPQNRIRFENIMLEKGLHIYDLATEESHRRMRPLGYGLPSHKNFGFGTLCFSYRNVPFNVPLVFWYPYRGWSPLFERKFVTYSQNKIELLDFDKLIDDYGEDITF